MRLNLIANGKGWVEAPQRRLNGECWGVNHILMQRPVDMVFEIHDLQEKFSRPLGAHCHRALKRAIRDNIPYVVRSETEPYVPEKIRVVYPWEEVFQYHGTDLIGSTFDAMMAYALYTEKFSEIYVYGFLMRRGRQYDHQRDSAHFWLGYCMGRGVKFFWNQYKGKPFSDMMRTVDGRVYGLGIPQRLWPYMSVMEPPD